MVARHRLLVWVRVCMLLVVPVSCGGGGSSRQPEERSQDRSSAAETTTPGDGHPDGDGSESRAHGSHAVPVGDDAFMDGDEATTVSEKVDGVWHSPSWSAGPGRRQGLGARKRHIGTADDPPAPGDPQDPAHGDPREYLPYLTTWLSTRRTCRRWCTTSRADDRSWREYLRLVLSDRVRVASGRARPRR